MSGKHRAPRPCWRVRFHNAVARLGHYGHEIVAVIVLHAAAFTAFETTIKHAIATTLHIGH